MPEAVTDANFEAKVKQRAGRVMLLCRTDWSNLAVEMGERLSDREDVLVCDVTENALVAKELELRAVPTLYLFKNGVLMGSKIGLVSVQHVEEWLAQN